MFTVLATLVLSHSVSAWGNPGCLGSYSWEVCSSRSSVVLMHADAEYPGTFEYVTSLGHLTEEG